MQGYPGSEGELGVGVCDMTILDCERYNVCTIRQYREMVRMCTVAQYYQLKFHGIYKHQSKPLYKSY